MPWRSKAQERWGHSKSGLKALGGSSAVHEWDAATKQKALPERTPVHNWIKGAVKHPGALSASAKRNGLSKLQKAEKESKSKNPHIRARGVLGKRFIKKEI